MRALDHLINCKNFQSFYKHKTIPWALIPYSKCLCLFCSLALVYSVFVPSQPVISQSDAVLMPNLATLFFLDHKWRHYQKKTKKNLHLSI